jgi:hypothetical protein
VEALERVLLLAVLAALGVVEMVQLELVVLVLMELLILEAVEVEHIIKTPQETAAAVLLLSVPLLVDQPLV